MKVSVIICTYSLDRLDDFIAAVRSVLNQTYDPVEVVLVIDGNEQVDRKVREMFGDLNEVQIVTNNENRGLSYSRTQGVRQATGEVVAFLDDDAVAEPDWIAQLVRGYEETNAIAVGGRMIPEWMATRPPHLPEEFFWLVGVDYEALREPWSEVRNTFGSNMSFRSVVFEEIGGFNEEVGLTAESQIQADETELALRMRRAFGKGMLYQPDAVVAHKVFQYRTRVTWLCRRAFWQGYSKRTLETNRVAIETTDEQEFLSHLVTESIPRRLQELSRQPSSEGVQQLVMLSVLTACVGLGYLFGIIRS
ncbi:glycosyltransferase [Halovenus sp. WSH3]|uniref:Glycosyltransferase n=1 Tax=Halovenus carboxidivorans TaxID=2692199 RepID=A0A6B0T4K7_9EURY|nr:glucosyl-dolichyl phosphate glucuronosyltransferase [Halovenus carboxidivorans]MXR53065.1 glycosyltransferase [Halovenus carboxidivorans]